MDTTVATEHDVTPEALDRAFAATLAAGVRGFVGERKAITLARLAVAYEQAQTEQDAGFMKHNREAEAMGRGRVEGLRLAVAILLECDDATASAVLDGMDTRE